MERVPGFAQMQQNLKLEPGQSLNRSEGDFGGDPSAVIQRLVIKRRIGFPVDGSLIDVSEMAL
jgi:hypothetical protein